jgi:subtilisin family serine protease
MLRRLLAVFAALTLFLTVLTPVAGAADRVERTEGDVPDRIADLRLDSPVTAEGSRLDATLRRATGDQRVIVRLAGPAVAETAAVTNAGKKKAKKDAENEQSDFLARALAIAPEARVIAQVQTVLNAVFLEVDASSLEALAADSAVAAIRPVGDYELDLSETVPYIGASDVQAAGNDGSGVTVAVLDSGIDYLHAALGGSGNPADHAANDPTIIEPGTFPTAKVVGGFDFVGSDWPVFGPEAPDPDPLDSGPAAGHGTHVADIIGGAAGVAPGVDLLAVQVCSSVSTSCSGIALIQGMDFAVDPDGNGDPSDAVDIINMSLGSPYGQPYDDDLSAAVDNASALGVLTVASAGNSADKPFITGSPSATSTALSVAQTQVPSASLQNIDVDGVNYPAVFQSWSASPASIIAGPVQYGDGAGGGLDGCSVGPDVNSAAPGTEPFPAGSLTGKVVLVDRGACNFSIKIFNVQRGGGVAGIIGLVAPGAPFDGSFGAGGPYTIPGYMISQADSNAVKAQIGNPGIGTVDPVNQLNLVGQIVGSSSRGPNLQTFIVKPEIGAPGASVSAEYGTGTGTTPFGGTSGAAPMVTGSAALLLHSEPGLSPAEAKARLVGTADPDIDTDPFVGLAPISRIGGGEVRANNAVDIQLAAWDDSSLLPTLSFGHIDVSDNKVKVKKKVRVRNYGDETVQLAVSPTFRYADDEASGAVDVKIKGAGNLKIKPGKSKTFEVELTINGALLSGNPLNSGSGGADGSLLNMAEFDGYIYLDATNGDSIHVPWHVIPRQAAEVKTDKELNFKKGEDEVKLDNKGVGIAQIDSYSLLDVSPNLPEGLRGEQSPVPDLRAVGVNTIPVPAGFCSGQDSFLWLFAINTWERQTHAVAAPAYYSVFLDIDQDGIDDYEVFNFDLSLSGSLSDGRNIVWAADLATGATSGFFFTEHSTVTGNTVFIICGEQVGLTGTDMLSTNVDATFVAWDWYFTGNATDVMGQYTITPLGEQYYGLPVDVPGKSKDKMTVLDFGAFPGNTPELGVMLVTNGDRGAGARGGATQDTEALIIPTKGAKKYVKKILKD